MNQNGFKNPNMPNKTTPKTKCSLLENDIEGGKNLNTMDIN